MLKVTLIDAIKAMKNVLRGYAKENTEASYIEAKRFVLEMIPRLTENQVRNIVNKAWEEYYI